MARHQKKLLKPLAVGAIKFKAAIAMESLELTWGARRVEGASKFNSHKKA